MSQGWSKIFNRINWLNRPSTNTPLNATNLNAGDSAIDKLDDRIITLDTVKADMQVVNGMVADVSLNSNTGVITVTYKNGSHVDYDTNLEKIAVNFSYDYVNQRLVLTLSDGSKQYVDMSALITQYEFKDSTTIAFSVDSTGKISASVKNGSITDAMLETGYLANITAQATKAESMANSATTSSNSAYDNAKLSQSYAIGGSGIREGEDTDNAMYYYEQAKKTDIGQISSEVAELNSNLSQLEYSDVAGGKNLFDGKIIVGEGTYAYVELPKSNVHISISDRDINVDISNIYFGLSNTVVPNVDTMIWTFVNNGTIVGRDSNDFINSSFTAKSLSIYPNNANTVTNILQRFNIQIEEGTTATPYEPYIPSVKMLAEENIQQSNSIVDMKMLGWSVPSECPIQNEVSGNQFIQKVGRVDLGSLTWYYTFNRFYTVLEGGKHTSNYNGVDAYCDKYNNAKDKDKSTFDNKEFSIGSNFVSNSTCAIVIRDDSYTNESSFKNAMQGVYLYYELATPITMTIDGNEAVIQIKNDLYAKQYKSQLNFVNCEYVAGGYTKIGNLVVVDIRIKCKNDGAVQLSGFPTYTNKTTNGKNIVPVTVYNMTDENTTNIKYSALAVNGFINLLSGTAGKEYSLSATYICD